MSVYLKQRKGRYEWFAPIPRVAAVLVGVRSYKSKATARKAANRAMARLFDRGDMV